MASSVMCSIRDKSTLSREDNLLLQIAQLTGGAYVPAGTRPLELDVCIPG